MNDFLFMSQLLSGTDVERASDSKTTTLGIQLHEDSEIIPGEILPQYKHVCADNIDGDQLDQDFCIEQGLFMSMLQCTLVRTKNLAAQRAAFAERLGIALSKNEVYVARVWVLSSSICSVESVNH